MKSNILGTFIAVFLLTTFFAILLRAEPSAGTFGIITLISLILTGLSATKKTA